MKISSLLFLGLSIIISIFPVSIVNAVEMEAPEITAGSVLPVSIEINDLSDVTNGTVTIESRILDKDNKVVLLRSRDFVFTNSLKAERYILIPDDFPAGVYKLVNNIVYEGVTLPATSQFNFKVIKTIFGIRVFNFILYSVAIISIALFIARLLSPYIHRVITHSKDVLHSE